MATHEALGIDFGGVIIVSGDDLLQAPPEPDCFDSIMRLNNGRFDGNVHIISRCGLTMQKRIGEWLNRYGFFDETGISTDNVHFCLKAEDKAVYADILGLTHMIDNKLDNLDLMPDVPNRYLYRPGLREYERFARYHPSVVTVQSWPDVLRAIEQSQATSR